MSKAYFYQLLITEKVQDSSGKVSDQIVKNFNFKNSIDISLIRNKRLKLSDDAKWVMFDLVHYLDSFFQECESIEQASVICGKLSSRLNTNTSKRNQITNESQEIDLNPLEEHVEAGTFFCVFLDTKVIVYLTAFGAPRISNAIGMFQPVIGKEIKILPVISKDALQRWQEKDITTSIEIETTLPSDEILRHVLNLSERDFDSIRNNLSTKVEVTISTGRSKSGIFNGTPFNLVDRIKGIKQKAIVKARDCDEKKSIEIDLIEDRLTREVDLSIVPPVNPNTVFNVIISVYQENIEDVLRYMRK